MKQILYIFLIAICCTIGSLFFLYQESWIIITSPFSSQQEESNTLQQNTTYKTVTLYAWQQTKLKQETTQVVHSDNTAQNIKLLLNAWLLFLEDEHLAEQENQISSVALSPSKQEAFISLNQYPFDKSWSTYKKLMWTESLLKTIKDNKMPIQSVRLLVHHQPIQDDHLNFELSWPVIGFTSQQKA